MVVSSEEVWGSGGEKERVLRWLKFSVVAEFFGIQTGQ
jgi:hypothetical protein